MRDWLSAQDPAVICGGAAALFCLAATLGIVLLFCAAERRLRTDPMQEAHGDLPNLPAGSISGSLQ
jgi:hypothetical protein